MRLRYHGGAPEAEISQLFSPAMEHLFALDDKVVYLDADLMEIPHRWGLFPV